MKKDIQEIEQRLRNGRLPDADVSQHRMKIWRRLLTKKQTRRKTISIFSLPPYIWALASIAILVMFFLILFYFNK